MDDNLADLFPSFFLLVLLYAKNMKKAYSDKRLACAAPKCWSKYTTNVHKKIWILKTFYV